MFRLFPLLASLSLAALAAQSPPQKSFEQVAHEADSARYADRVMDAIGLYREGVELRPSWSEGWLWLGNLLYDQDRFPEAQASFTQFLASEPKPGPVWALKGLCEFETRDFAQSKQDLETWVHSSFQGPDELIDVAAFHWALLLTQQHEFKQALYVLSGRAAHRGGESPVLIEALGLASLHLPNLPQDYPPELRERVWLAGKAAFYIAVEDYARGQEYSQRLLAGYGDQPGVHYLQGSLFKTQLRADEAAQEFRKELQISPQHVPAMLELAQFEIDGNSLDEALTLSRHAAQLEPANPDAHHILGRALLAAGRTRESVLELESAERLAPGVSAIHFHLATAYRKLGRNADAQREMTTFVSLKEKQGFLDKAVGAPAEEQPADSPK